MYLPLSKTDIFMLDIPKYMFRYPVSLTFFSQISHFLIPPKASILPEFVEVGVLFIEGKGRELISVSFGPLDSCFSGNHVS